MVVGLSWLLASGRLALNPVVSYSRPLLLLFLAIPLWSLLQLPFTLDVHATLAKLQKSLAYALLLGCALQLLNSKDRLRLFANIIVISGLFQACYGVITALGGQDFDLLGIDSPFRRQGMATGTYMNRNHLAGWLEMCLPVGIGLLIASLKGSGGDESWRVRGRELLRALLGDKGRLRLFLIAMVIALVMTRSRMGNTAFFTSMGISALIGYALYRRQSRSMVILFVSMILIDVFIISSYFGLEKLATRIETTQTSQEGRLDVNHDALLWLQEHWLAGSGAGTFVSAFPAYRSSDVAGFYDFAHNDYLQILGEYGVIGAAFFAAIALLTLWTALQAQRQRRNALLRGMGFAAMMGMLSLLIHSATDFNLHIPANASLLTLLCGLACTARYLEDSKPRRRRSTPSTAD
ncbi:MAG TPA: O-antigen ligase family protein [Moraxellaceae bacterium]